MKRATVTIPDDLQAALDTYRRELEFPPSLAAVVQAALREYLQQRGYSASPGGQSGRLTLYEQAPPLRGEKTAADVVLEDRS